MIAKLITTGPTREAARKADGRGFDRYGAFRAENKSRFSDCLSEKDDFISGDFSTAFIAENFTDEELAAAEADAVSVAVLAVRHFGDHEKARAKAMHVPQGLVNFTSDEALRTYKLAIGEDEIFVSVRSKADAFSVHIGDDIIELDVQAHDGTHMVLNSVGEQYVSQKAFLDGETCICDH